MPFGINLPNIRADIENKPIREEKTEILNMNCESAQKTEISALGYRHTYTLDPNAIDPKLLPPPKRDISRPLRDKNVRAMRLRPRQVLCSNCKQGIHENSVNVVQSQNENHAQDAQKLKLGKGKQLSTLPNDTSKRDRRFQHSHLAKIGPVIKISYATPRGGGAVMKIPPRPHIPSSPNPEYDYETFPKPDRSTSMTHAEYHKLRKAFKKAKLKKKLMATGSDPVLQAGSNVRQSRSAHHKKSKHSKHKMKRKHRHKDDTANKAPHYQEITETELREDEDDPEFQEEDHAVPVGDEMNRGHAADPADDQIAMWTQEDGSAEQLQSSLRVHEEYSIINADEFSLKRRIKRNVLRQNDDDSNSGYSIESFHTGTSHNSDSLHQAYFSEEAEEEDDNDSHGFQSENEQDEIENYDNCDSSNIPNGDAATFESTQSLMMRIHTKNITKCIVDDERTVCTGDIVWGKILGFPWWPGRVMSITVSQRDNGMVIGESAHIAWFGSSTMSHMPCSELYPYLDYYKLRYNKKKRGPYKVAVRQATLAAQGMLTRYTGEEMQQDEMDTELEVEEELETVA